MIVSIPFFHFLDLLGGHSSERILRLEFEARCSSIGPNFSEGIFYYYSFSWWLSISHIFRYCVCVCVCVAGNDHFSSDDDGDELMIKLSELLNSTFSLHHTRLGLLVIHTFVCSGSRGSAFSGYSLFWWEWCSAPSSQWLRCSCSPTRICREHEEDLFSSQGTLFLFRVFLLITFSRRNSWCGSQDLEETRLCIWFKKSGATLSQWNGPKVFLYNNCRS